jgi:hypothetical protein
MQSRKAFSSIAVTELGRIIDVRLRQLKKARLPIVVTELGRTIDVRLMQ